MPKTTNERFADIKSAFTHKTDNQTRKSGAMKKVRILLKKIRRTLAGFKKVRTFASAIEKQTQKTRA